MKRPAILLIIPLLLSSCGGNRLNYDKGIIPPLPVNFSKVNSTYDDYNSMLHISWSEKSFNLIFSTNRISPAIGFDFICYGGNVVYDLIDGEFTMNAQWKENSLVEAVNSSSNEFGPYFTADYPDYFPWKSTGEERFFYSSDPEGNLDIFCCNYELGDGVFTPLGDPFPLTALNTDYDEGYLSIHSGGTAANRETVYFMSDRGGSFDIWSAAGEEGKLINESSAVTVTKVPEVSSTSDDKCPFICGNMMVFASDRPGGHGGFDLWYSVYTSLGWSAPVNMGDDINTEYDEYRPMVVSTGEWFLNDLMIFSSNRPGGKGGFDLYYVGVPRK